VKPSDAADLEALLAGSLVERVEFVADVVEIGLSNGKLTCLLHPHLEADAVRYQFPHAGSRDALCSLIGRTVSISKVDIDHAIDLEFDNGARLHVPLQSTDWYGEAALFRGSDHDLWVFDAAAVAKSIRIAHPIIEEDEMSAVIAALDSGQLAQGPRVAAFERAFAGYVGTRHAIAVNSGTAALHVALMAHGIAQSPPGVEGADRIANEVAEVIVPAFSFAATANVVLQAGARAIFVDVRDDDFNIDLAQVETAITPRTRAVIAVHLYGLPCNIEAIAALCERRGIALIEDAAQSVGASVGGKRTGAFGAGCFSFYATKNLQTGEGGMVTTDDDAVADRARMLRSQGERTRYVTEELGWNYRMTEPAAALGLAQMPKIDARNAQRAKNAARLNESLAPLEDHGKLALPRELPGRTHVWHQYTVRVLAGRESRDRLQESLKERGIESAVFYPTPIHRQPLYQRLGYGEIDLPVAQRLADEVLSLPVHPALSDDDLEQIGAAVRESLG
jgi:dTDP-4-amino-4,6-dideoxygalactose transaminase